MSIDAGLLFALIGCLVGVAVWITNLIKRTSKDAEWRGTVSGKLDGIQLSVTGMQDRYDKLDDKVDKMSEKLTAVDLNMCIFSFGHKNTPYCSYYPTTGCVLSLSVFTGPVHNDSQGFLFVWTPLWATLIF